jgi:Signal transduction histidine kinase
MSYLLLSASLFLLYAQKQFVFTPIDTKSGLSENRVRYILQLPDGRMLISTEGITNIYDGTSFKYMHIRGSDALPLVGFKGFHREYVDDSFIWLKYQGWLMLMSIKQERSIARPDSVFAQMGIREPLSDFFMDSRKNYWIRTASDKLLLKAAGQGQTSLFLNRVSFPNGKKDELYDVMVVGKQLFLFYRSGLMSCHDLHSRKELYKINILVTPEEKRYDRTLFLVASPTTIYQLRGSAEGKGLVMSYNIAEKRLTTLLKTDYWLNTPSIDRQGNFWIGCRDGIWMFDKTMQKKQFITSFKLEDGTEINGEISSQYHDSQGGLWLGTYNRGLLYYHPDRFKFTEIGRSYFGKDIKSLDVKCFAEQQQPGRILVGTSRGVYDYQAEIRSLSSHPGIPANADCISILRDSHQRIWLATANSGLYCLQGSDVRHYDTRQGVVLHLCETSGGLFFVSTDRGFSSFNPATGELQPICGLSGFSYVAQLIQIEKDRIMGRGFAGLFIYDFQKKKFSNELHTLLKNGNQQYNCLYRDRAGRVWIGTQDGLSIWKPDGREVSTLNTDDGLINNSVKGIIEDNRGRVWVTTAGGVSRISVSGQNSGPRFQIVSFNHYDGVLGNEFSHGSVYLSQKGLLLLGGVNGFNAINLQNTHPKNRLQKPLFKNLFLFGNLVKQGESYDGNTILSQSLTSTGRIVLNHDQNFIGIEFSGLNYVNPTQTYFRYRLEGMDDDWREIPANNGTGMASYTNLSPGTYRLQVKSANSSKEWLSGYSEIEIVVKAPFWQTPFAYVVYLVLLVLAVYLSLNYYQRMAHRRMARLNEEKLNRMKFNFFTNVSHEFRTPLTLIITPLESILKEIKDAALESKLRRVYHHARDLQGLVTQLLDFRRLEVSGEKLNLTFGDAVDFVRQFEGLFSRLALEKGIELTVNTPSGDAYIYFDREKLYRILNNLLSNAFKYTPRGGKVGLTLILHEEQNNLRIEVTDTGKGIPAQEQPFIFDRFYQATGAQEGSGIGLHLVKEYVRLHSGEIGVESEPDKRTCFTVILPMNLTLPKAAAADFAEEAADESTVTAMSTERRKLLVVEDNEDLRTFLAGELSKSYDVLDAPDGEAGYALAQSGLPDLIISDVMMPGMDGLELCRRIKSNPVTSHIPVILLTARTSEEHKLQGYQSGADEYLPKPFNLDLLLLRIAKLTEQQNRRQQHFSQKLEVNPKEITITSLDEKLVEKALACIEQNMDNPKYSVQQFSEEMGMDRTVLYKKLQSITGLAPSEFIRSIRLKRAAQLLAHGQFSVSEVADRVGFNTQKYFTKYFREAYGVPPSQYAQSQKSDNAL